MAGNGEKNWEAICDQLDLFHQRLLNVTERKANASAQHRDSSLPSQIKLNQVLLSPNSVEDPFPKPITRASTVNSDFCDAMSGSLTPVDEKNELPFKQDFMHSPAELTLPLMSKFPSQPFTRTESGLEEVNSVARDSSLTPTAE